MFNIEQIVLSAEKRRYPLVFSFPKKLPLRILRAAGSLFEKIFLFLLLLACCCLLASFPSFLDTNKQVCKKPKHTN